MSVTTMDMTDDLWAPDRPWTVADLEHTPDDGQRYEIIDGGLLVSPPPSIGHQGVAHRLAATLNRHISPEWEALEGVGVLLHSVPVTRMLVPDVIVASSEAVWSGYNYLKPADVALAIEIVSSSSIARDRTLKPALLAEVDIPAYWRIEQGKTGALTVVRHRLTANGYTNEDTVQSDEIRYVEWPVTCRLAPAELSGSRD